MDTPDEVMDSRGRFAAEVIVQVAGDSLLVKNAQLQWLLKHINQYVSVETAENDDVLEVIGITASDDMPVDRDEKILIVCSTKLVSITKEYVFSFILDFSPSTFVVDTKASCVPHARLEKRLQRCLEAITREVIVSGKKFSAEIILNVCFYSPFISFDEDWVIVQGIKLNAENLSGMLEFLRKRINEYSSKLCSMMQPHLKKWNQERRKVQQERTNLLPENFFRQQSIALENEKNLVQEDDYDEGSSNVDSSDEGYLHSEWSIVFMLRLGLLGLRMVDRTESQPNIVLLTNSVCHITDIRALQQLLTHLHYYSATCSFVQLEDEFTSNSVFGHFSSPEFFHFLAHATGGAYVANSIFSEESTDQGAIKVLEYLQDSLLFKKFSRQKYSDHLVKEIVFSFDPEFIPSCDSSIFRRVYFSIEYECSLDTPLRMRLKEGFSLKELRILEKNSDRTDSYLVVVLTLPWKSQVAIDYKIVAPWPNYNEIMIDADRTIMHIHSFNAYPSLCSVPQEVQEKALLRYVLNGDKVVPIIASRELEASCTQNAVAANFVEFWKNIHEFEEFARQKWFDVHVFRIVLANDYPFSPGLFLPEESHVRVTAQGALTVLHQKIAGMTTFSLIHGQSYVKFITRNNDDIIPFSFYIAKLNAVSSFAILKLAFFDGLNCEMKNEIIKNFIENLQSIMIERRMVCTVMREFADSRDDAKTIAKTTTHYMVFEEGISNIHLSQLFICRFHPANFAANENVSIFMRRLNEGFQIAYSENGIVNLVRQMDGEDMPYNRAAVFQYIIFSPSVQRPLRINKEQMESMQPLSKSVKLRATETMGAVPNENYPPKNDVDVQIMTELWMEPVTVLDEKLIEQAQVYRKKVHEIDERIICALCTFDQLITLCGQQCANMHFTINESHVPEQTNPTCNVRVVHSCFSIGALLASATERELLLLPTLSYQIDDHASTARLQILLESLHVQLSRANHISIEVRSTTFWHTITSGIDCRLLNSRGTFGDENATARQTLTRVYVARVSPWRILVTVLPVSVRHVLSVTSCVAPTVPVLVYHCDEPSIAARLAQSSKPTRLSLPTYVSDHRTRSPTSTLAHLNRQIRSIENPSRSEDCLLELHWLSTARINNNENRIHTSFDLHSYCEVIEDQLFSRALIATVYRSLLEGIEIPHEDLVEVLEDRCEQSDIEVDGIDECVRFLCSHVTNIRKHSDSSFDGDEDSRSSDFFKDEAVYRINCGLDIRCKQQQEDFRRSFDELLARNFRKIPNFPSYFYYMPNINISSTNQNIAFRPYFRNIKISDGNSEDVEICYSKGRTDKNSSHGSSESNNSANSNKSSTSFETASHNSDDGTVTLNDICMAPLFLNFSCAIRFSNMDMHTFPVERLPSCVIELLESCPDVSKAADLIGITFDIYVLTWPSLRATIDQADSITSSPKLQDTSPSSARKVSNYFDFENLRKSSSYDAITRLPHIENEAVKCLQRGITRLLHMETVLISSRVNEVSLDTINKVIGFISSEASSDVERIKHRSVSLVMVMDHAKAIRRLKERLKNLQLLYCRMNAHAESNNIFYCCSVSDPQTYSEMISSKDKPVDSKRSAYVESEQTLPLPNTQKTSFETISLDPPLESEYCDEKKTEKDSDCSDSDEDSLNTAIELESKIGDISDQDDGEQRLQSRKKSLHDFWIVLVMEANQIKFYFCERFAHHHEALFDLAIEKFHEFYHDINQELLLEKMLATNECDSLLIDGDVIPHKFGFNEPHEPYPDTKLTRSLMYKRPVTRRRKNVSFTFSDDEVEDPPSVSARVAFAPGHFACRVVAHHWFYIHPRLHTEQFRAKGFSLILGLDALRQGIEHFAVRNRRNLYVYCEQNKRNIFYMQLFTSFDHFSERCTTFEHSIEENMAKKFDSHVLLAIHGIREPGDEVRSIVETMQKRLDLRVLEELTTTLQKNPHTRLNITDIEFIQREPTKPFAIFYCTLPSFTNDYLGSVYFYLFQQMLTFTTEARFRDNSGSNEKNPYERLHFHEMHSDSTCQNYVPRFFLINRPPTKGSSFLGIACVETCVVDVNGVCVGDLQCARISPATYSKLYPGGAKTLRATTERFHELTRCMNTTLPLPDSLMREKSGVISHLVQYSIWQVGDVGLSLLQPRFRLALQQALCDLVTEFGILGISVLSLSSPKGIIPSSINMPDKSFVSDPQRTAFRKRLPNDAPGFSSTALVPVTQLPSSPRKILSIQMPQVESSNYRISGGKKMRSPIKALSKFTFESVRKQPLSQSSPSEEEVNRPSPCTPEFYMNCQFTAIASQWFDYVVSEVKNTEHQFSVKKYTFHCESEHSMEKIFAVIHDKLHGILFNETITVCKLESKSFNRFSTQILGRPSCDDFMNDNGRVVNFDYDQRSLIIVAYNYEYAEETLKYGAESSSNIIPSKIEAILSNPKENSIRFPPQFAPFVPRQHLLYLQSKGEMASLYLYNYSADVADRVYKMVARVLSWQNARSRLVREIGLNKMGISHLPMQINVANGELVWYNAELLSEYEFPDFGSPSFDQRLEEIKVSNEHADQLLRIYRHVPAAFLPMNMSSNLLEDQCCQLAMLQREMRLAIAEQAHLSKVHSALLNNVSVLDEADILKIVSRSREVHFLHSPLLLFTKWRKQVAAERRFCERSASIRQTVASVLSARRASGSKMSRLEALGQRSTRFGRSNTFSIPYPKSRDRVQRRRGTDEDEPCCLKIQFMLVESYVDYMKKLGLHMVEIRLTEQESVKRYSLQYDQNTITSPNVWMYKAFDDGIFLAHITIDEPYFRVRFLVYTANQQKKLGKLSISCLPKSNEDNLENFKDNIVSMSKVHSFTYDFHLRMVATYLIGGQQVLFNHGYNTNEFLIDFLQYYNCRPLNARNCIYEEKMEITNLPTPSQQVWEYLLIEKRKDWRIVRLKQLELDLPGQFMIVAEQDKDCFGLPYKEIRVALHESQPANDQRTLNIKFYVILVSHERNDPLIEDEIDSLNVEDIESGEFKQFKSVQEKECSTDEIDSNQESEAWSQDLSERRRFCSGDNINAQLAARLSRKYSDGSELGGIDSNSKIVGRKLSIQSIAPLRHRRMRPVWQGGDSSANIGAVVPGEQAIYVYYFSGQQKRLQEELEDSVSHYKKKLQVLVDDAIWHCRRNQMWDHMIAKPPSGSTTASTKSSIDLGSLRTGACDIDALLGYVKAKSLIEGNEQVTEMLTSINSSSFYKLLIANLGVHRCRLFYSPPKEHLVILTSKPQDAVFLLTTIGQHLEIKLLLKERESSEASEATDKREEIFLEQFDEIIRCAASTLWIDLIKKYCEAR